MISLYTSHLLYYTFSSRYFQEKPSFLIFMRNLVILTLVLYDSMAIEKAHTHIMFKIQANNLEHYVIKSHVYCIYLPLSEQGIIYRIIFQELIKQH